VEKAQGGSAALAHDAIRLDVEALALLDELRRRGLEVILGVPKPGNYSAEAVTRDGSVTAPATGSNPAEALRALLSMVRPLGS
jgi:hypothetical protein